MKLFSVTAAAKELNLSRSRLYQLIRKGRIKVLVKNLKPFITQKEIDSFERRPAGYYGHEKNLIINK